MDKDSIIQYIINTFEGVDVVAADDNSFLFYNPGLQIPPDHKFPFVTIVTNDKYDQFSNLDRPSVFRVNVGIGKKTYQAMFGSPTSSRATDDFTALDRIMPHPVYAAQYWICVLSPSDATFEILRPLLAEAYDLAAKRHPKAKSADQP